MDLGDAIDIQGVLKVELSRFFDSNTTISIYTTGIADLWNDLYENHYRGNMWRRNLYDTLEWP